VPDVVAEVEFRNRGGVESFEKSEMSFPSKTIDLFAAAAGTAAFTVSGGFIGPCIGLPGGGTGVLCGLPIAVSAVVADRSRGLAAVAALALAGLGAAAQDLASGGALVASAITAASVGAALALAGARRREHEVRAAGLERINDGVLEDVARHPVPPAEDLPSEEEVVGYATTLLSVQEAGRRIATHLDLDTLVPTVLTTVRSALDCRDAAVYFWDARTGTLRDALPARSRDAGRYVPDPMRGTAKWVIEHRQVLTAHAAAGDPDLAAATVDDGRRPAGVAPLLAGNELLGLLVADEPERSGQTFGRLLYILANLAALGIKNAQLFRRIEESARRDALTGLLNRGGFEAAADELLQAARDGSPLALLIADFDHFKRLNDRHGHHAGDEVLREAARVWRAVLPQDAVVARYGGEEFVAALPGSDLDGGRELAEALREAIAAHPFVHVGETLAVSASFGVAELGRSDRDLTDGLRRADRALYQAKAEGRNRVRAAAEAVEA